MQDTTTRRPALSRTWRTHNTTELDRVVVSTHAHTVTLSRDEVGGPLTAEVDGKEVELKAAVMLLEDAYKLEVLAEVLAPNPAPTIGKARAHKLHVIMGRLGLMEHYGFARRAIGEQCFSLAALTEEQARKVWALLVHWYGEDARRAAA